MDSTRKDPVAIQGTLCAAVLDRNHVRVLDADDVDEVLSKHSSGASSEDGRVCPKSARRGGGDSLGISECSFAERGPDGRYGYRAFGVPELALSRLEPGDLVVSPYSSFLALVIDAPGAVSNLRDMKGRGWLGAYGFYEACDFTPTRVRAGEECEHVVCWMAHHQGMSLVAAANALCNSSMQRRFHAEPMVAATERLLHEAARGLAVVDANEKGELDWLTTSVPVLRNVWPMALPARHQGLETPPANQANDGD